MAFFRRPKTTQERKLYIGLCADQKELDVVVKLRAARSSKNLPDAWNDEPRSSYRTRSWKIYRGQQYR